MGIEPTSDCLQSILASLEHASPKVELEGVEPYYFNQCAKLVLLPE